MNYAEGGYFDNTGYKGTFTEDTGIEGVTTDKEGGKTKVYSINGQLLKSFKAYTDDRMATEGLPAGLYIVNGKKKAVSGE